MKLLLLVSFLSLWRRSDGTGAAFINMLVKEGDDVILPVVGGAAPKPSVTILDGKTDWARLQCEVHGAFPKPDVHWQNGAGDIVPAEEPQVSERGGRYDIILQRTVIKTDHYRCVSTQEEIHHQTHAEIFVLLNDAGGTVPVSVVVIAAVVGFALGGIVVGLVVYFVLKKKTHSPLPFHSD